MLFCHILCQQTANMNTIEVEAKQMVNQAIAKVSNDFVQRKKDELIAKWFADFMNDDEDSFEDKYKSWELDAFFGNYTKQFTIPSIEEVCDAINDQAINWHRFNDYFQENLKVK